MSIPDIDYELGYEVGQYEYSVALASASTPEDMGFVAKAFDAGIAKERQRVLSIIKIAMANGKDNKTIIKEIESGDVSA